MSIRSAFVITICGGVALAGTPAAAQDREDVVGPVLEDARRAYAAPEPERELPADCPESADNEIVVCAPVEQNPDQYRVQSRLERGDESHLEWTGQAPDVSAPGIFKGPATVSGCIKGINCPPPPAYIIDFSELPEAPPGSDADRIARGLAPRGSAYDGGTPADGQPSDEQAQAQEAPPPSPEG